MKVICVGLQRGKCKRNKGFEVGTLALESQKVLFIDGAGWTPGINPSRLARKVFSLLGPLSMGFTSRIPISQWLRPDGPQGRGRDP